jgi:protein-tyrosine phosphatase
VHVLAHCRAGVGRAGLTACAWAIKMGIAGPLPDLELQLSQLIEEGQDSQAVCENARVMSTVERVICLIRRRRSIKAIETFEQVNFLASYVAWLRRESGLASANEMQ